jgi:type IV secretory pathway VirB2 component (pilin)|tara:strand:+ start:289 stop:438 length:150 start_codon:yes stop_codon:yes gene_type:complete
MVVVAIICFGIAWLFGTEDGIFKKLFLRNKFEIIQLKTGTKKASGFPEA